MADLGINRDAIAHAETMAEKPLALNTASPRPYG
jgi:hypothetical protein